MAATAESFSAPPFPTRFPRPPRLALSRRRWPDPPGPDPDASPEAAREPTELDRLAHQVEFALARRERAVTEAEARLADRVRDLDEMDALLRAREALLTAARLRESGPRGTVTLREAEALHRLRDELDRQEAGLREARQGLLEREQFLERSETQLLAKVQQQQERETELDQREENLSARAARLTAAPVKPAYDEFRE